ncbi:DUF4259 domain-containing protein [Streptomyces flaveolus]|uniref:DUF4259 domain-containing protein n=1 Tax=Streptomyces flaveolus TaxID=67297 RepID=A0ABV3AKZ3_9ACTN
MGTWGTSPFDSDLAADFVNELEGPGLLRKSMSAAGSPAVVVIAACPAS